VPPLFAPFMVFSTVMALKSVSFIM
jgi:hypothetical protein